MQNADLMQTSIRERAGVDRCEKMTSAVSTTSQNAQMEAESEFNLLHKLERNLEGFGAKK